MSVRSELELAEAVGPDNSDDAHELQEHEFTLDPDDGEHGDCAQPQKAETRHVRAVPPPPPPPRRAQLQMATSALVAAAVRSRSPSGVFPIAEVEQALSLQASLPSGVTAADAEISRLKAQLRARDAYVVEIERALDEWTQQMAAAGIEGPGGLAQVVGRARGHAYRAAELEAELSRLAQENAQLRANSARAADVAQDSSLRRVRGIGRRYAQQLEALGVVSVEQIAAWTQADVVRIAGKLRIPPSRITHARWIDQARALCAPKRSPTSDGQAGSGR